MSLQDDDFRSLFCFITDHSLSTSNSHMTRRQIELLFAIRMYEKGGIHSEIAYNGKLKSHKHDRDCPRCRSMKINE